MSIKGDFISFTYNGVHSTELGIVRTSSSNRYNDQLVPTSQDKTVPVPGGNGTYFFGSYYTQRAITLDIAYDEVTEATLRRMRKVFEADTVHELIFDDEPYKVYYAKVTGQPQLKYIPFQNYDNDLLDGTPRIYKGEGTINFTCYDPFAHCPNGYKKYTDWTIGSPIWYKYDNKNEWNLSAMLTNDDNIDKWNSTTKSFLLYNPGDIEADYMVYIPINNTFSSLTIRNKSTLESHVLSVNSIIPEGADTHVCFNSKTNLLEGIQFIENVGYQKTNNIYNKYLEVGEWFKIPKSLSTNWVLELTDYNDAGSGDDYSINTSTFILSAGESSNTFIAIGNIVTSVILTDAITGEVLLASIEILKNKVTIALQEPIAHNINVIVTSITNNPNKPFIEYDYLYY